MKRLWPGLATTAPAVSALLAGLLFLFVLVAASLSTHETLHQCVDSGPGDCAVCLLLHGQVAVTETGVAAEYDAPVIQPAPLYSSVRLDSTDLSLPPGRGPPALLVAC